MFGSVYVVAQLVIAILVHTLGTRRMVELQPTGFSAAEYARAFAAWEAAGTRPFYRAHLIFDDLHWIWYAIAPRSAVCTSRSRVSTDERHWAASWHRRSLRPRSESYAHARSDFLRPRATATSPDATSRKVPGSGTGAKARPTRFGSVPP